MVTAVNGPGLAYKSQWWRRTYRFIAMGPIGGKLIENHRQRPRPSHIMQVVLNKKPEKARMGPCSTRNLNYEATYLSPGVLAPLLRSWQSRHADTGFQHVDLSNNNTNWVHCMPNHINQLTSPTEKLLASCTMTQYHYAAERSQQKYHANPDVLHVSLHRKTCNTEVIATNTHSKAGHKARIAFWIALKRGSDALNQTSHRFHRNTTVYSSIWSIRILDRRSTDISVKIVCHFSSGR